MKRFQIAFLPLSVAIACGQSFTPAQPVDFSLLKTVPNQTGVLASRPSACSAGQTYFATDATAGQNLSLCSTPGTPGTWTAIIGGVASYPSAGITVSTGSAWGSSLALDTDTALAANSDVRVATQKAIKAYVDAHAGGGGSTSYTGSLTTSSYTLQPGQAMAVKPGTVPYSAQVPSSAQTITVNSGSDTGTFLVWLESSGSSLILKCGYSVGITPSNYTVSAQFSGSACVSASGFPANTYPLHSFSVLGGSLTTLVAYKGDMILPEVTTTGYVNTDGTGALQLDPAKVQGSGASVMTAATVTGAAGTPLCIDSTGAATTAGCRPLTLLFRAGYAASGATATAGGIEGLGTPVPVDAGSASANPIAVGPWAAATPGSIWINVAKAITKFDFYSSFTSGAVSPGTILVTYKAFCWADGVQLNTTQTFTTLGTQQSVTPTGQYKLVSASVTNQSFACASGRVQVLLVPAAGTDTTPYIVDTVVNVY